MKIALTLIAAMSASAGHAQTSYPQLEPGCGIASRGGGAAILYAGSIGR